MQVGQGEFLEAVALFSRGLSETELEQGVLEVLAFPPDVDLAMLGRRGLLAAAFRRMDCDASVGDVVSPLFIGACCYPGSIKRTVCWVCGTCTLSIAGLG